MLQCLRARENVSLSALSSIIINNINNTKNSPQITVIDTSNIHGFEGPQIILTIPLEILKMVYNEDVGHIRIVSAVYRNVTVALSYEK